MLLPGRLDFFETMRGNSWDRAKTVYLIVEDGL